VRALWVVVRPWLWMLWMFCALERDGVDCWYGVGLCWWSSAICEVGGGCVEI
jgi:hypothetical protein